MKIPNDSLFSKNTALIQVICQPFWLLRRNNTPKICLKKILLCSMTYWSTNGNKEKIFLSDTTICSVVLSGTRFAPLSCNFYTREAVCGKSIQSGQMFTFFCRANPVLHEKCFSSRNRNIESCLLHDAIRSIFVVSMFAQHSSWVIQMIFRSV